MISSEIEAPLSSLAYLEEYLDTLSAIPQQVQHSLSRLSELDCCVRDRGRTTLASALQNLHDSPTSPEARADLQAVLLQDIQRCEEKKAIADSLLHSLEKYSQQLEDDLVGFQEDLKAGQTKGDISIPPKRAKAFPEPKQSCHVEEKVEEKWWDARIQIAHLNGSIFNALVS